MPAAKTVRTHHRGFTLIELMIVMGLVVLLVTTATTLFFSALVSDSKSEVIQTVKEEGDFALTRMEFLLRNAVSLQPNSGNVTCGSGMTEIRLKSYDNGITTLFKETDSSDGHVKIASNSGIYLTSDAVDITSGPTFNCTQSADRTSQFIDISFTLRKGTPGIDQPTEIIEQTFNGSVNIRSF